MVTVAPQPQMQPTQDYCYAPYMNYPVYYQEPVPVPMQYWVAPSPCYISYPSTSFDPVPHYSEYPQYVYQPSPPAPQQVSRTPIRSKFNRKIQSKSICFTTNFLSLSCFSSTKPHRSSEGEWYCRKRQKRAHWSSQDDFRTTWSTAWTTQNDRGRSWKKWVSTVQQTSKESYDCGKSVYSK